MATTTRTTMCLLLLLLAAAAAASSAHVKSRDLLGEEGAAIPKLSDEKPPDGHLSYRIVKGVLEKASGRSARLDLERGKEEKLNPLLSIP